MAPRQINIDTEKAQLVFWLVWFGLFVIVTFLCDVTGIQPNYYYYYDYFISVSISVIIFLFFVGFMAMLLSYLFIYC